MLTEQEALKHGKEFLDYVEANLPMLKHNLRKNITYNEDYFDDAINDSIVKMYDRITKGRHKINDFRNYFFLTSKNTYIIYDNKYKNGQKMTDNDYTNIPLIDETEDKEPKLKSIERLFKFISERLEEEFESGEVDIFIIYFKLKSGKNRISYDKLSNLTGLSVRHIMNVIQKLKSFVQTDEIILKYKRQLENEYLDT